MKLIYAGTPDFAVPALQALLQAGHDILAVYTQPDRRSGRGRKISLSPVKQCALDHSLEVRQPASLKDPVAQAELATLNADAMIVAAYGLILPQAVLDAPHYGCLNIHASLLPRWRGAAPIQRAILAGDEQSGITIMQMEAGLDTGPMLLKRSTTIGQQNAQQLHDQLMSMGAEMIVEALQNLPGRALTQDETQVTYAHKLLKAEAALDWHLPATELERQIRAYNPWPVSHCVLDETTTLRVFSSTTVDAVMATPGKVLQHDEQGMLVACGENALRLLRVQLSGRKAMSAAELRNSRNFCGLTLPAAHAE